MLERVFLRWHRLRARFDRRVAPSVRSIKRAYWTALVRMSAGSTGTGLRVNGPTYVTGNVHIGDNCHFNGLSVHGGARVDIGDNFHSAPGVRILTINHNYEHGTHLPYDTKIIERPVRIGPNVWIGEGVVIAPGTQIGEGVVIAAAAVVAGTVKDLAVVAGNPARQVKERDAEHYYRLKSLQKFI